ncbi:MAG TPA: iron-containing redox enzyme family protein, partial [Methylomirabilota bacterium]|nr:iron-containing redox enzyme family protein [Methylomirabilota bacterium]
MDNRILLAAAPLAEAVEALAGRDGADVDRALAADGGLAALLARVDRACDDAYTHGAATAELAVQRALYEIYKLHVVLRPPGTRSGEGSFVLDAVRTRIEARFLASLDRAVPEDLVAGVPADPEACHRRLLEIVDGHPANHHPLYVEYLPERAGHEDLKYFLTQESTIDANTDDFLALLQVGAAGPPKMEIAANYWDEMGNGEPARCHSTLFVQAVAALGGEVGGGALETAALACGNLQLMLSLRRRHFYKAIGYFFATEHMAPGRFKSLMVAWRRNALKATGAGYHEIHIPLDVQHSNRWFDNVIAPVV